MKTRDTDAVWIGIILAILVAVVVIIAVHAHHERDACEERGGTVVPIHNSQAGEWFCQEPR